MTDAILAFMNWHNGLRVREKGSQGRDSQARNKANLHGPPDQSLFVQFRHFFLILGLFDIFDFGEVLLANCHAGQREPEASVIRTAHASRIITQRRQNLTLTSKLLARLPQFLVQLQLVVEV